MLATARERRGARELQRVRQMTRADAPLEQTQHQTTQEPMRLAAADFRLRRWSGTAEPRRQAGGPTRPTLTDRTRQAPVRQLHWPQL